MEHIASHALHGKPTRWLQVLDLEDMARRIGGPIEHIELLELTKHERLWLSGADKRGFFFIACIEGELMLDQKPMEGVSGRPGGMLPLSVNILGDGSLNALARVEADQGLTITGNGKALMFSEERIVVRAAAHFRTFEVMYQQFEFSPVNIVYVVHMEPGGTPAGNHLHKDRHELMLLTTGQIEVGTINLPEEGELVVTPMQEGQFIDERKILVPPYTAHAVRNTGEGFARVVILATAKPRYADDFEHVVFEPETQ